MNAVFYLIYYTNKQLICDIDMYMYNIYQCKKRDNFDFNKAL